MSTRENIRLIARTPYELATSHSLLANNAVRNDGVRILISTYTVYRNPNLIRFTLPYNNCTAFLI